MIITGSNTPIIFRMPEPIDTIKGFSITLCKCDAILKHWTDEHLRFADNMVIAPLSQQETINFPTGTCSIHLKWLDSNGVIKFNKNIDTFIHKNPDRYFIGDGNATTDYVEGIVYDVDTKTGEIIVRGYSPKLSETNTWIFYDDEAKRYVDTGVIAEGKDGVGIKNIKEISEAYVSDGYSAFEIELTDGTTYMFRVKNGRSGVIVSNEEPSIEDCDLWIDTSRNSDLKMITNESILTLEDMVNMGNSGIENAVPSAIAFMELYKKVIKLEEGLQNGR